MALAGIATGGATYTGRVDARRWFLQPASGGAVVDRRGRLLVPLGVRYALRLDRVVGLSWRGDAIVVWPAAVLDALVEGAS